MNWILGAAAPALVGGLFLLTGRIHPAILAYHALCLVSILRHRDRVRTLLGAGRSPLAWAAGSTVLILGFLAAAPLIQDPSPHRATFLATLFPWGRPSTLFAVFAVYTLLVHAPLEEIFWRAVVMDPERGAPAAAVGGNAVVFYLLHAVPMALVLGPVGLLYAVPTAAAGAFWAFVTIRTRSLWPGLVSHWGADAAILGGMWFYFIR